MNTRIIDISLEVASLMFLVASIAFFGLQYNSMPETVTTHFNAMGEADGYSSKQSVIWMVVANTGLYLLLTVLVWFPRFISYPVKITEANRDQIYAMAPRMLRVFKFLFVGLFSYTTCTIIYGSNEMSPIVIFAFMGILLIYTLYLWYRMRQVSHSVS